MDFQLTEDQRSIRDLARKILSTESSHEKLKALDKDGTWYHAELWSTLAQSELLGVCIDQEFGGAGMGIIELGLLLMEQGRTVAPIPLLPCLTSAKAVAKFGSMANRTELLRSVCAGTTLITYALYEEHGRDAEAPKTQATSHEGGYIINGTKDCVPFIEQSNWVLVPASVDQGAAGIFLLSTEQEGISYQAQTATNGQPMGTVGLTEVAVEKSALLSPASRGDAVQWLMAASRVGISAIQQGIAERQLEYVAEFSKSRKQFDRSIATFQAVSQRAGDAYINVEAMRLTAYQALWRLEQGLSSQREVAIAKYWAAEGGHQVAAAAQHIHGGMGVDKDYPLYRYSLWARHLELEQGGANQTLAKLGAQLAS